MFKKQMRLLVAMGLGAVLAFGSAPAALADEPTGDAQQAEANAAEVGDTQYATLSAAVEAAGDGATVRLLRDVKENVSIAVDKNITLDLNGKTLDLGTASLRVAGSLVIDDGTASELAISNDYKVTYQAGKIVSACASDAAVIAHSGGSVVLRDGIVESKKYTGIASVGNQDAAGHDVAQNSTVTVEGGYISAQEYAIGVYGNRGLLNMRGGAAESRDNGVIAGNGNVSNSMNCGGTEINISGGTLIGHITTQGYIAMGVYHPQEGVLNITGGTIYADGGAGIVMRAGELNMTGGEIIATGDAQGWAGDNKYNVPSTGIYYDLNAKYPGTKEGEGNNGLTISGGSVKAENNKAPVQVGGEAPEGVTFDAGISGGTFSAEFDKDLLVNNATLEKSDGGYGITRLVAATVDDAEYYTLQEAIDAAGDGATIKIANDITIVGEGTTISGKKLTIDLNGHVVRAANSIDGRITISDGAQVTLSDSADAKQDGSGQGKILATKKYGDGKKYNCGIIYTTGEGTSFTLESGLIDAASEFKEPTSEGQYGIGVFANAAVVIKGGKVQAGWYAISGNGNTGNGGTTVNVEGGILESTADYAIYNPNDGAVIISDGVVYGAAGGIFMNRGDLVVEGGIITSKGVGDTGDWGDGTGGQGKAAINLNGQYGDVAAIVTGGKITAEGDAVVVAAGSENEISLEVSGGTFSGMIDASYIVDGFTMGENEDGTYGVEPKNPSAVSAVSLIAYEGGEGDAGLPAPEWQFEDKLFVDGEEWGDEDAPFQWAWVDKDGESVAADEIAGAGVYTLTAWADPATPVVQVGEGDKTKTLDFTVDRVVLDEDDEPVTVEVREIVKDVEDPDAFRSVYGSGPTAQVASLFADDDSTDACDQAAPHAHVAEGTTFLTNGNESLPVEGGEVVLLWDALLSEVLGSETHMEQLTDKAMSEVGTSFKEAEAPKTQFQYIDLVDMANGNAWVQTADNAATTIFMPYGEDMTADDVIEVVYFDKLTRDYTLDLDEADLDKEIAASKAHKVKVTKAETGILFDIPSGDFGPIEVLSAKAKAAPEPPAPGPEPEQPEEPEQPGTPEKPEQPTQPEKSAQSEAPANGDELPATGDIAPVAIIASAALGATALGAGALARRKK